MGADVEILLLGDRATEAHCASSLAELLADRWMRTFNRFQQGSEISRLNAAGRGQVSRLLFTAIDRTVEATRMSRGAFNPLILPALIAAGYDRSIEFLSDSPTTEEAPEAIPGIEQIQLCPERRYVELPEQAQLDLNGIAKGLYADELAHRLPDWPGGIVSAGGDMRVWGEGPEEGRWAIGVEPPDQGENDLAVLVLSAGGIATSGVNRRSWRRGTEVIHHLIDPGTGAPTAVESETVTVLAATASLAETAATALFIEPALATYPPFASRLWATIRAGADGGVTIERLNAKEPFDVYTSC